MPRLDPREAENQAQTCFSYRTVDMQTEKCQTRGIVLIENNLVERGDTKSCRWDCWLKTGQQPGEGIRGVEPVLDVMSANSVRKEILRSIRVYRYC